MFLGAARKLCPGLVTVPYEFDEYQRVSQIMYDIVLKVWYYVRHCVKDVVLDAISRIRSTARLAIRV